MKIIIINNNNKKLPQNAFKSSSIRGHIDLETETAYLEEINQGVYKKYQNIISFINENKSVSILIFFKLDKNQIHYDVSNQFPIGT